MHPIEEKIDYVFQDPALLEEALTHPSTGQVTDSGAPYNYERLEFLGDSVLGLVIAEILMETYPDEREGGLAKRQAALVRGEAITDIAASMELGRAIIMSTGEKNTGGRNNKRNLENALEAVIGALYLDGGLKACRTFIRRHWLARLEVMVTAPKDAKTALQEWAQKHNYPVPEYHVAEHTGPAHHPKFTIEVRVKDCPVVTGEGASKKAAEQDAARALLDQLTA